MTLRRVLFSLAAITAMCVTGMAKPPEARELDPVARDYYASPPATSEESVQSRTPEQRPADSADGSFLNLLFDNVLTRLTIPLGTVKPAGGIIP
jgi:hypothetical protein